MSEQRDIDYAEALSQQRKAAHPQQTRLASANAGSGKTRVLVDRVSRILLRETPPEDILCLTYTKAAAAEMQARLFKTLGQWCVMPDAKLTEALEALFGKPFSQITPAVSLDLARQLFARALETPEGLKVQTIHAFCERILSRFPIEAGIMPGFEPMDDEQQRELRAEVKVELIEDVAGFGFDEITKALQKLTLIRADQSLDDLFNWMSHSPEKILLWKKSGGVGPLAKVLGLESCPSESDVVSEVWIQIEALDLKSIAEGLRASGSPTDVARADSLFQAATQPADDGFAIVRQIFFTQKGELKKSFYTNAVDENVKASMDQLAGIVAAGEDKRRGAALLDVTEAVYELSCDYARRYQARKHTLRALDFSDQILLVRNLLIKSEVADWVRYKLDGGIEHILVDEAQDTSPEQWQIIDALADPFFQDDPDRKSTEPRTLFAVGDEKQSIYSFQGADPQKFLGQIQHYLGLSGQGEVRMRMSFRSTQQVLNMVDQVLIEGGALREMFPEDYPPGADIAPHIARREDAGCVELWPITPKPDALEERAAWDTTPVDALGESHQRVKLAKQIAQTIRDWIDTRAPIFDRELGRLRPMTAGDVLILVQRRNSFFEAIIQQLKKHDVPVAGADRLTLKDAIIVKDLLSLGRFCLLTSDDLSLAEVLKSPLIGFDDDDLFEVAVGREGDLWSALQERRPDVAALLGDILKASRELPPFDFYTSTLERMDETGHSLRERFFRRLSMEAREALDAFLARALDHQFRRKSSLQHFIRDFAENDVQIKRDLDLAQGQARVMTVHGAKGLEAPIVFLPDTTSVPRGTAQLIPVEQGFAWNPPKSERPTGLGQYFEDHASRGLQEHLRLLYVAMTRAETRLIICGFDNGQSKGGVQDGSWYARLQSAFEGLPHSSFDLPSSDAPALRFGNLPAGGDAVEAMGAPIADPVAPWMRERAAPESLTETQSPSRLLGDGLDSLQPRRPRVAEDRSRYQRGRIIHKLLEVLPDFPADRRGALADQMLSRYRSVSDAARAQIKGEVLEVLSHPDFAHIFAKDSRSEVMITGTSKSLPDGMTLNAQIDRLCVTDTEVLIVDYKSDRDPPEDAAEISDQYIGQMAAYRALVEEIYPNHIVKVALLWTDVPRFMALPNALLDEGLQKIGTLPKSTAS